MTHNQNMKRGQALIIILLILAVITTIGLSVASRSVTEVSTSITSNESTKALSAAESGVELALSTGSGGSDTTIGYVVTVDTQNSSEEVTLVDGLKAGEVGTIFWANHDNNGNFIAPYYKGSKFNICWGKQGTAKNVDTTPAIETTLYYLEGGVYKIARLTFDPNQTRSGVNKFTLNSDYNSAWACPAGQIFAFNQQIKMNAAGGFQIGTGNPLFLQVRLFYNDISHPIGVKNASGNGTDTFPSQGTVVTSVGTAGGSTKKVQVLQTYGTPYSIFNNAVFSGSDLVK